MGQKHFCTVARLEKFLLGRLQKKSVTTSEGQIITIGETPAAKFLNSNEFKSALRNITGNKGFDAAYNGTINPDGTRTQGMWDIAQKIWPKQRGRCFYNYTIRRTWQSICLYRIPSIIGKYKCHPYNGIPREDLVRLRSDLLATGPSRRRILILPIRSC